jgi:hypothetical protein
MSDQISLVCTGIQAIGAAVSGITKAFDVPPAGLDTAELPALYAFTGPMTPEEEDSSFVTETRIYRVQVAVLPTGQGDPNTREALCRPLIEATVAAYRSHYGLGGVAGVQTARVVSDTGVVLLPEWGGKFIGFEIRLAVTTIRDREYARGG